MNSYSSLNKTGRTLLWLFVTVTVILLGWALKATGAFMIPLVFSIFLALLVAPLDQQIAKIVPEKMVWLGHVAAIGAIIIVLLIFLGMIWIAAQQVIEEFPMPKDSGGLLPQFGENAPGSASSASTAQGSLSGVPNTDEKATSSGSATSQSSDSGGLLSRFGDLYSTAGGSLGERLRDWAASLAGQVLSLAGAMLSATVLIIFLTLLMLIEGPSWKRKFTNALDESTRQKAMTSVDTIAVRLRQYLFARTVLGLITAVLYVTWLWIFGVNLLIVWALLAFALNYIPTVGSLIAGGLAVLYAFMQKDFGTAMIVGVGILVIEQVMGNYIDPRVQGRQVSLSSLVVLISLLIWGWVWGVAGAILAVPITIATMIVCAHIPPLRLFALMLSNAVDMESLDRRAGVSGEP